MRRPVAAAAYARRPQHVAPPHPLITNLLEALKDGAGRHAQRPSYRQSNVAKRERLNRSRQLQRTTSVSCESFCTSAQPLCLGSSHCVDPSVPPPWRRLVIRPAYPRVAGATVDCSALPGWLAGWLAGGWRCLPPCLPAPPRGEQPALFGNTNNDAHFQRKAISTPSRTATNLPALADKATDGDKHWFEPVLCPAGSGSFTLTDECDYEGILNNIPFDETSQTYRNPVA